MLYENITDLIGNTPLLKIDPLVHGLKNIDIYAKLEYYNPFGSVKDRIAWGILKDDIGSIQKEGKTIIESSSGNTAKAMQCIASVFGVPFETVTNRIKVPEVKNTLALLGATIEELPGLSECPDSTDPNDPLTYIENKINNSQNTYYHTAQYTNTKNPKTHYETTGPEIFKDLGSIDYFFGGLGTAGSTMGVTQYLKEKNSDLVSVGIIAAKGDTIPGIRNIDEMYEVGIFNKDFYDDIVVVNADEAIDAMLLLIRKCGILAGPTTGSTYHGMYEYLKKIDRTLHERKKAVFIACDRVEWYMSYIQKRKPEIFEKESRNIRVGNMTDEDIASASIIKIEEAENWIQKEKPLIIDLRGNAAYRVSYIPGSINITDNQFIDIVENGKSFPDGQNVLLICPIGEQSRKIAAYLKKRGSRAFSLEGGIIAWRDAGKPLSKMHAN